MENGDAKNDQRDTSGNPPPITPKKQTRKQRGRASNRSKKTGSKKAKTLRQYWNAAAPLRRLEIAIGAIIATAAVATCFIYVWGNLQPNGSASIILKMKGLG